MAVVDIRPAGDLQAMAPGKNEVAVLPLKGLLSVSCAPVLCVRELVCGYAGVPVTAGVSFEVGPGEVVVLRGANGAGKSTVLRTAVGQQAAVSGDRWLKGGPVVENSLVYRRAVSCLFDEDRANGEASTRSPSPNSSTASAATAGASDTPCPRSTSSR